MPNSIPSLFTLILAMPFVGRLYLLPFTGEKAEAQSG